MLNWEFLFSLGEKWDFLAPFCLKFSTSLRFSLRSAPLCRKFKASGSQKTHFTPRLNKMSQFRRHTSEENTIVWKLISWPLIPWAKSSVHLQVSGIVQNGDDACYLPQWCVVFNENMKNFHGSTRETLPSLESEMKGADNGHIKRFLATSTFLPL